MSEVKFTPIPMSRLDMAFGGRAMDVLPPYSEIPDEFKHGRTTWNKVVTRWFFSGLPAGTKFIAKPGVDEGLAFANIRCAMGSFKPKHEHKSAGCAYLLSQWYERIDIPEATQSTNAKGEGE